MNKNMDLKVTKIPKELKLILKIIKGENELSKEWYVDIDWDLFLNLALHHRLYPLLYSELMKTEGYLIPSHISKSFYHYYQQNTYRMLHLYGEMEKMSRLFNDNKIRHLFLKGPILAADLYGDISKRTSGDLDILVCIEDLNRVNELLESKGYEKDEYILTVLNDWKWRHHHFTYYHPSHGTKIEVHWRLNPAPSKEPTFDELWSRKKKSSIASYPTYIMGDEDLFFFLVTHGARHGWSRLRWLVDIHQMIKKNLKWDRIYDLLRKYQSDHIGGQSIILANQLLGTIITKDMSPFIKGNRPNRLAKESMFYLEQMVNLHTEPVPNEIAKYHKKHLFSLMSFQQKSLYILSMLHPYYTDVETLPLPKEFHFLYFPLRPFLWILRKTRKHTLP
ncbi:nucleotidyltransferase family protein [Bacillus sp. FJAT-50079]|uniref:nucleotidyltransferase domain-containing protein n=1 Tax=Bacillus sp. FJAT-50079 TaxID=2833577 RepID=UPI001BC9D241|nr:nucleotidyltransferase family protein [Bacillus sp. FJAT-50079]MBS4209171.1 nucleotidyltransferase family protein [Bacillus sp. FJAT-50079]